MSSMQTCVAQRVWMSRVVVYFLDISKYAKCRLVSGSALLRLKLMLWPMR
jgi:hypothetical protein